MGTQSNAFCAGRTSTSQCSMLSCVHMQRTCRTLPPTWKGEFQRVWMCTGIIHTFLASLLCRLTTVPMPLALRTSTPSLRDLRYNMSNKPTCSMTRTSNTHMLDVKKPYSRCMGWDTPAMQQHMLDVNRPCSKCMGWACLYCKNTAVLVMLGLHFKLAQFTGCSTC